MYVMHSLGIAQPLKVKYLYFADLLDLQRC